MYTIRTILGTTLGLTVSGVRWDIPNSHEANNQASPETLLARANTIVSELKKNDGWAIADWHRMNELRGIMEKLGQENTEKRKEIMTAVDTALNQANLSEDDKKRFTDLKNEFSGKYTSVDSTNAE
jgi:hypothetical protein